MHPPAWTHLHVVHAWWPALSFAVVLPLSVDTRQLDDKACRRSVPMRTRVVLLCCLLCWYGREMAMLQEVDQPGSSIDQYVDALEAVLAQKLDGIRKLQSRLDRFKNKLRQEDLMSRTVQKKQSTIHRI